jgi:hypothetical protein
MEERRAARFSTVERSRIGAREERRRGTIERAAGRAAKRSKSAVDGEECAK